MTRNVAAEAAALSDLMNRAFGKRYVGPVGARRERPVMVELFHAIGNAEDNANDTCIENQQSLNTEEGRQFYNEAFVASLYTDNVIVRKILAKFGFRF